MCCIGIRKASDIRQISPLFSSNSKIKQAEVENHSRGLEVKDRNLDKHLKTLKQKTLESPRLTRQSGTEWKQLIYMRETRYRWNT